MRAQLLGLLRNYPLFLCETPVDVDKSRSGRDGLGDCDCGSACLCSVQRRWRFDRAGFIAATRPDMQPFLTQLVRGRAFQEFLVQAAHARTQAQAHARTACRDAGRWEENPMDVRRGKKVGAVGAEGGGYDFLAAFQATLMAQLRHKLHAAVEQARLRLADTLLVKVTPFAVTRPRLPGPTDATSSSPSVTLNFRPAGGKRGKPPVERRRLVVLESSHLTYYHRSLARRRVKGHLSVGPGCLLTLPQFNSPLLGGHHMAQMQAAAGEGGGSLGAEDSNPPSHQQQGKKTTEGDALAYIIMPPGFLGLPAGVGEGQHEVEEEASRPTEVAGDSGGKEEKDEVVGHIAVVSFRAELRSVHDRWVRALRLCALPPHMLERLRTVAGGDSSNSSRSSQPTGWTRNDLIVNGV